MSNVYARDTGKLIGQSDLATAVTAVTRLGTGQRRRATQTMLGYFGASLDSWTSVQNGGSCVADTSVVGLGTQSFKIAPLVSNFSQIVSPNITSINLTNKNIRVWFRYTGDLVAIMVQPSNTTDFSTNRAQFNILDPGYTEAGEDAVVDIPITEFVSNAGTFDKTAMTKLRITVTTGAGGGTVWVYGMAVTGDAVASLPNGAVVFSVDDSYLSQRTFVAPTLAKYGYAATLYPSIEGLIGGNAIGCITLADALYLQNVYGWDIGCHTLDLAHHVNQTSWTESQLRTHFEAMIAQQTAWGFQGRSYAWPQGASSLLGRRIAGEYFESSRGGSRATPETFPAKNPQNYRSVIWDAAGNTLAQVKAYVDRAKAAHGVIHIAGHDYATSSPAAGQVLKSDFTSLVDYVFAQGVPVYTQNQIDNLAIAGA